MNCQGNWKMFICGFWETYEKNFWFQINSHRSKWALLLELVCLKLNTIKRQRIYHQLWHRSDEDVMVNSINTYKYVALKQLRKIAFVSPAVTIIFVSTQSVINYLVLGQKSSANKQKNVIRVPPSIQKYGGKNSRSAKSDCGKSIFTLMLLFSIILRIQNGFFTLLLLIAWSGHFFLRVSIQYET